MNTNKLHTMRNKYIFFIIIVLNIFTTPSFSQGFIWKGGYDFIGDNREFTTYYGYPETILGSRLSAVIGYQIDTNQAIFGGGSYMVEHGEKMFAHEPVLSFYYQYKNQHLDFQLGSFPIENATFPKVLYTDSLLYYRPNYQGARGIISHKLGQQTLLFDWHTQDCGFAFCLSGVARFGGFAERQGQHGVHRHWQSRLQRLLHVRLLQGPGERRGAVRHADGRRAHGTRAEGLSAGAALHGLSRDVRQAGFADRRRLHRDARLLALPGGDARDVAGQGRVLRRRGAGGR